MMQVKMIVARSSALWSRYYPLIERHRFIKIDYPIDSEKLLVGPSWQLARFSV